MAKCEIASYVESCEECGFCSSNINKRRKNMIIKKYAESNMDESAFFGRVEVETDTKSEFEEVVRTLANIHDDSFVCHCNMKENAELIAAILDYDTANEVYPLVR